MKNKRNTFIGLVAVLAMISTSFLSKSSIFVGCILITLLILGAMVYFYFKGKDKKYLGIYVSLIIMTIMCGISYSNAFSEEIRGITSIVGILQLIIYVFFYVCASGNSEEEVKMKKEAMRGLKIALFSIVVLIVTLIYAKLTM